MVLRRQYLDYAETNRKEWEANGEAVVAELVAKYQADTNNNNNDDDDELNNSARTHTSHGTIGSATRASSHASAWALLLDESTIHDVNNSWEQLRRLPDYDAQAGRLLFQQ